MEKGLKWKFALILAVTAVAIYVLYPIGSSLNLGLDLKGGVYLVYRVDESKLPDDLTEGKAVGRALEIIRNRIDQFGVREPDIQRTGDNRIVVALPGVTDTERAKDIIGKTALLEFKLVNEEMRQMVQTGLESEYELVPCAENMRRQCTNGNLVLSQDAKLTGRYIQTAQVRFGGRGGTAVSLSFDQTGAREFGDLTSRNVGNRIAIVLDGKVISAPEVEQAIRGGEARITGQFKAQEARDLALMLRAGSLPAPLELIEERSIGPSLGEDSIRSGLYAAVAALILVIVFMAIYYQLAGLIANITLAFCLLLLMGGLAGLNATLTLPGIAGIILTIGMAVDANVIVFERIKEELQDGKPIRIAVEDGFDNAFTAIVDAQVTTIITAVALYWFGTGPVKGFAVTLTLGILASLFSAIFIGKFLFAIATLRPDVETLHIGWGNYRQ
ncbi:MAG: protein translocase subunit SecD [bacterium]